MKTITKQIPDVLVFRVDPEKPDEMNQEYPFMKCVLNAPTTIATTPWGDIILTAQGVTSHMEDERNALYYGGIVGRTYLSSHPEDSGKIQCIGLINFCHGNVPDADPEDGCLKITWPQKTIRYPGSDGKLHSENIDIIATYVDMEKAADPEGDTIAQMSYLFLTDDAESISDPDLKASWIKCQEDISDTEVLEEEKLQREMWKAPAIANVTIDLRPGKSRR